MKVHNGFLQQGVPPPASNTTYSPPACSDLQQLLNELSGTRTNSLKEMTPLGLYENIETGNTTPCDLPS